jgi:iron complex transport system substrate-binding protein
MSLIRSFKLIWAVAVVLLLGSLSNAQTQQPQSSSPQRIVSLAPNTTEILFALGLGDRLVGVTRYCDYPPAALTIQKIGGYVDPNYEAIVSLKPDLVVLLTSHQEPKAHLEQLHLSTVTVPHKTIHDIHEAIQIIGSACAKTNESQSLIQDLTRRTQAISKAVEGKPRPRVLICIGRDTQSSQLTGIYAAGHEGFYDEIIQLAGGVNAYTNAQVPYPQLSAEGIVQINPDVIVDIVSDMVSGEKAAGDVKAQWKQLGMVSAVRQNRIHIITGNHALRPGPRYIQFLEQMAQILHGDASMNRPPDADPGAQH